MLPLPGVGHSRHSRYPGVSGLPPERSVFWAGQPPGVCRCPRNGRWRIIRGPPRPGLGSPSLWGACPGLPEGGWSEDDLGVRRASGLKPTRFQCHFAVHESAIVQVFGRRHRRSDRTLCCPASEKRQGTKSRREVVLRQCRKLTGAPRALMGIWTLGWAGSCPAVTSGVVCSL